MKEVIKHLRIAIAHIFLSIGYKINAEDDEDIRAKIRRLDPDFEKCGTPLDN